MRKKSLNLAVPTDLLEEFNRVCATYGHGKQKGMVLSAAILMFLRADANAQGACLKELAVAEIDANVRMIVERARAEHFARTAAVEKSQHANDSSASNNESAPALPRSMRPARKSKRTK